MMTLWCFLQGNIPICRLKIKKKCHGMVLFAKDGGGGRYRFAWDGMNLHLGWTRGQNHMHIASQKGGPISPGGEGGRVHISFREENLCGATHVV